MKLYGVFFHVEYEGEDFEGIFSTEEKALDQVTKCMSMRSPSRVWDEMVMEDAKEYGNLRRWVCDDIALSIGEIELDKEKYG